MLAVPCRRRLVAVAHRCQDGAGGHHDHRSDPRGSSVISRRALPYRQQASEELFFLVLEIARLIADDLSNKQIAARLFLSERTVEAHVTNILNRLGLNSRVQISRWIDGL